MSKEKVLVSIDADVLAVMDQVAEQLDVSRSKFVEMAIETSLDDWRLLSRFGFTPARAKKLGAALKRLGVIKSGDYEVEVPKDIVERMK